MKIVWVDRKWRGNPRQKKYINKVSEEGKSSIQGEQSFSDSLPGHYVPDTVLRARAFSNETKFLYSQALTSTEGTLDWKGWFGKRAN